MYTINKTNGIGEVIAQDENSLTVYFSETDKTSKLLKSFTKVYATLEEAELALNPELTEKEAMEIVADAKEEERIMNEGKLAQARLEVIYAESSKKLMRNI